MSNVVLLKKGSSVKLPGRSAAEFNPRATQQSVRKALGDISTREQKLFLQRIAFLALFKED